MGTGEGVELQNRDKRQRRLRLGVGLVFVAVLGLGVWVLVWKPHKVRRELAKIRAAGEPITPRDLAAMYELPPAEEDTTQLWLDAFALLHEPDPRDPAVRDLPFLGMAKEPPPPGEPWPQLEAAEKLLAEYAEPMRLVRKAAQAGGKARFPVNFQLGYDIALPHVNPLRVSARLLELEANVRAQRGDAPGAADSIHAIFSVGRSLENEPLLISHLCRVAIDGPALREIERLLPVLDFPEEDLVRFQTELRALRYERGLYRAMLGERVLGIQARRDPDPQFSGPTKVFASACVAIDLPYFLQTMEPIVQAAREPSPQAMLQVEQITKSAGQSQGIYVMTAFSIGSLPHAFQALARVTSHNRAADAAIGLELFRRRHGRLPERLEELVPEFLPEVPGDPFDGKPLRYAVREGEYVVYSVGVDRTDDGGEGNERGEPDVVFRVRLARQTKDKTEKEKPPTDADERR